MNEGYTRLRATAKKLRDDEITSTLIDVPAAINALIVIASENQSGRKAAAVALIGAALGAHRIPVEVVELGAALETGVPIVQIESGNVQYD